MRQNPHVRICGGPGSATTLVYPTWSRDLGIGMTLFEGWESIIDQALFWAGDPKPTAARRAVGRIHQRLIAVEASPGAVDRWARLTGRGVVK